MADNALKPVQWGFLQHINLSVTVNQTHKGETLIITKYRDNNGYKGNSLGHRVTVWEMRVPRVPGKASLLKAAVGLLLMGAQSSSNSEGENDCCSPSSPFFKNPLYTFPDRPVDSNSPHVQCSSESQLST